MDQSTFFITFFSVIGYALGLIILIGLTIWLYLFLDNHKRIKDSTLRVIYFIGIFVIAFAMRLACAVSIVKDPSNLFEAFSRGVQTFYFQVAGIGFEGQDISTSDIIEDKIQYLWCISVYFGSMLWLAASYIIIITAGVSYDAYSFFLKIFYCRLGRRSEYYVFTNVSEDALNLADNIREKKGDNAFIVFAGENLDKFDNSIELHKKIRQRKYPYIILPRKQLSKEESQMRFAKGLFGPKFVSRSRHTSVLLELGLLTKGKLKNCSFHVFSMQNDENKKGLESVNSDAVYDDLQGNVYDKRFFKRVIKPYLLDDKDNPYFHVDYYVLTNNSINYEFYAKNTRRIITNYQNDIATTIQEFYGTYENRPNPKKVPLKYKVVLDEVKAKVTRPRVNKLFKINVINEAYLSGLSLLEERRKLETSRIEDRGLINYSGNPKNNDHVAIFLGFGQTGQTALHNLFIDTSTVSRGKNESENGIPPRFIAHVFDENIIDYAGQFEKNHPSYLIFDTDKEDPKFANKEQLEKYYKNFNFEEVDKYMKFPHIYLHRKNCNSLSLLQDANPKAKLPDSWEKFNSIVIALGDDEANIMTANSIIQSIRQKLYSNNYQQEYEHSYVDIYVNIRNDKNRHRLNWNTLVEEGAHPYVRVIRFGNADEMYSFKQIINNFTIEKMNSIYGLTGNNYVNFEFVRGEKGPVDIASIRNQYKSTMRSLNEIMTIEGFVSSIKLDDFINEKNNYRGAYLSFLKSIYGKINDKEYIDAAKDIADKEKRTGYVNELKKNLFNIVFDRDYAGIYELVNESSFKRFKGEWKLGEKFDERIEHHLEEYSKVVSYYAFKRTVVELCSMLLVVTYDGKDLFSFEDFKAIFLKQYNNISKRKMRDIKGNRKAIIASRYHIDVRDVTADYLFQDISKTQRSFYLDSYATDATRYALLFANYYDAYIRYIIEHGNGEKLSHEERNFLAQLEHLRWARYTMSRGAVFTEEMNNPTSFTGIMDDSYIHSWTGYKDKEYLKRYIKLHKDIVPFQIHQGDNPGHYLDDWLEIYDYINALCAPFVVEENKGYSKII